MIIAVCGAPMVGKSSLIQRIKHGSFSVQYFPTKFTEIHKIIMGDAKVALVETSDVIKCDLALILCRRQREVVKLWRKYCLVSRLPPVIVRVGERLEPEPHWLGHDVHTVSNLSSEGVSRLIYCIYIKHLLLNK